MMNTLEMGGGVLSLNSIQMHSAIKSNYVCIVLLE
jgi:hypothetical protein